MNIPLLPLGSKEEREARLEQSLIRREAEIGGRLFGPVPRGHKRQFFCLDEYTWIWYEEWKDQHQRRAVTTHYSVRPDGVIKSQDGQTGQQLTKTEARNLYQAVGLYQQQVGAEYQRLLQAA